MLILQPRDAVGTVVNGMDFEIEQIYFKIPTLPLSKFHYKS